MRAERRQCAQAYLSAETNSPQASSRFSGAHEHPRRPKRAAGTQTKGPEAALCLVLVSPGFLGPRHAPSTTAETPQRVRRRLSSRPAVSKRVADLARIAFRSAAEPLRLHREQGGGERCEAQSAEAKAPRGHSLAADSFGLGRGAERPSRRGGSRLSRVTRIGGRSHGPSRPA